MRSGLVVLEVVTGVVLLASCSNSTSPNGGGSNTGGHSTTITVSNNTFQPTPDTVAIGSTVTFSWAPNSVSHNVTWDAGPTTPPNSATMSSGAYTTPALDAGTYTYHCTIHVALGMQGTIVVR